MNICWGWCWQPIPLGWANSVSVHVCVLAHVQIYVCADSLPLCVDRDTLGNPPLLPTFPPLGAATADGCRVPFSTTLLDRKAVIFQIPSAPENSTKILFLRVHLLQRCNCTPKKTYKAQTQKRRRSLSWTFIELGAHHTQWKGERVMHSIVNSQLKLVSNYLKRWSDLSHECWAK